MRIVYAYEGDATDINVQSGRPWSILRQLERRGHEVIRAFPLDQRVRYLFAWKYQRYRRQGRTYRPDREPLYLRALAWQVERRIRGLDADLLFAPGSHVLARLRTGLPTVYLADATFANVLDTYDSFEHCAPEFVRQGHDQERRTLARAAAAVFPSAWAARTAVEAYGAQADAVHVVPFGANLDPPPRDEVAAAIEARAHKCLEVLFLGRDWQRKGGEIVLEACARAQARGVPLRLHVVGLAALPVATPPWATVHGRLDKNHPAQYRQLTSLLSGAHVLFVPSRAENYGMMFCEAAGFGVPALTSAVGGITSAVKDGETGFALPPGTPAESFADRLQALHHNPALQRRLAHASLEDYHARLNWDVFGNRFDAILDTVRARHVSRVGARAA